MLDPRIYRAGLVPALLAFIVGAFSIETAPRALTTTLPPDSFSGPRAAAELRDLAHRYPSRHPGGAGDDALGGRVRSTLRGEGFRVHDLRFEGRTVLGERTLRDVVGVREGLSSRQIVVVAHRDALPRPATADLSGTAALLELARVFNGRTLHKTLVLASTSGGSGGAAGAARLAGDLSGGPVDAVLVLGDMAGRRERRPMVVPWSNDVGIAPVQLRLTADAAVALESGLQAGQPGALSQFARLAFPLTVGEQGELAAGGLPAILLSRSGERGPGGATGVSADRLGETGRAAVRSISALDAPGPAGQAPRADVYVARKVVPGWAVRLVVGALILPVLIAAIDGLARARRRRHPVGMWLAWVVAGAVPFAAALAFAFLLRAIGLTPAMPPAAAPPSALPLDAAALGALGAVVLALAVGWLALRPVALHLASVRGDRSSPGAAAALALALVGVTVAVWAFNPFAAALLLPALHGWLLITAPEIRMRRPAALAVVALSLLPGALVTIYYMLALGIGPLKLPWYALTLAAGGQIGVPALIAWCLLLGCLVSVVGIVRARGPLGLGDEPVERPTIRGPLTYAGPGSLGGTESALRR
jgi:hypothetical protein